MTTTELVRDVSNLLNSARETMESCVSQFQGLENKSLSVQREVDLHRHSSSFLVADECMSAHAHTATGHSSQTSNGVFEGCFGWSSYGWACRRSRYTYSQLRWYPRPRRLTIPLLSNCAERSHWQGTMEYNISTKWNSFLPRCTTANIWLQRISYHDQCSSFRFKRLHTFIPAARSWCIHHERIYHSFCKEGQESAEERTCFRSIWFHFWC